MKFLLILRQQNKTQINKNLRSFIGTFLFTWSVPFFSMGSNPGPKLIP